MEGILSRVAVAVALLAVLVVVARMAAAPAVPVAHVLAPVAAVPPAALAEVSRIGDHLAAFEREPLARDVDALSPRVSPAAGASGFAVNVRF